MSGSSPAKDISNDGVSISVAGLLWQSKEDTISLDVKSLNFATKHRRRKVDQILEIPTKLTRRQCTSKVAEIFNLTGMFTPITAAMKIDLHELVVRKLDWDDPIPDELKQVWINHFSTMSELSSIKFQRAIIPSDAINTEISLLSFGDASRSSLCVAIYARLERTNGLFSCQLVFGRSKLVTENLSQPRAELYTALVNCHSLEIVKRAFYRYHKTSLLFTDSQVVLFWLNNQSRTLKQWVRNRVIEIKRFSGIEEWRYVSSQNMIADIGTRRGATLQDVNSDSTWHIGFAWMVLKETEFPSQTVEEISLTSKEISEAQKEYPHETIDASFVQRYVPSDVQRRYQFSKYLIDPNKFRFKVVVKILSLVIKFNTVLRGKVRKSLQSGNEIESAQRYFNLKASAEIKHFYKPSRYEKFSKEKDGILYYTGRILESDKVSIVGNFTEVMRDLSADTFCVPIIDKHSPLAYAIANEVHWYNKTAQHSGVETVWRYVLKDFFIMEGRSIIKFIKDSCERCRYLQKKKVEVAMAPISRYSITLAPCFYNTQVDLCGPFNAFSAHQKRATVKIWLVVFCCCVTSATSIKVMENYSSSSFIQAFTRFSCTYGYPKCLISDEGSQIVKAFGSMKLNYIDIKNKLYNDVTVNYELVPVGGHNMTGKVERKIREVQSSLEKSLCNQRLSILHWETLCHEIANNINNRPLALGNVVSGFETMDLLTPNRLILGRNNERSPVSSMVTSNDYDSVMKSNQAIFDAWFEVWLLNHVPKLMHHPKWFKSNEDLKIGDIVLFLKRDSEICATYRYGTSARMVKFEKSK